MTDLQLSILAIGGGFVLCVLIFNKWQEYKARKSIELAFLDGLDDVLMQTDEQSEVIRVRQEPHMHQSDQSDPASAPVDLTAMARQSELTAGQSAVTQQERDLPVDALIDCIIPLEFETPVRGEKLLEQIKSFKFVGKKPVHFVGMTLEGQRDVIAHGGIYTILFAGVQLVSRGGPLSELEYSQFVNKLREIAEVLNAHPEIADMNKVMSTARNLHQFVTEHDAQLSVNVLSNGAPWEINTLLGALEKQGFDVRPDGRLVMPDGDGGNLFTLSTNVSVSDAVTSRLTLLLDVPCVSPVRDGFGALAACAKSLATRLSGTVVDDGNNAISKQALDEIAEQVNEFYAAMNQAEIPAGSQRAQRLFS